MERFAQSTSVVDSLRSILNQYPHGIGTFRELLQNSDDAGATEQIFILDRRNHSSGPGFDSGSSFLAYNDASVMEDDWVGLQEINSSPKRTDTGKTGKYGLGFRSCFHITDTPEILSGRHLATFDPLQRFLEDRGVKRDFIGNDTLSPHLDTFGAALTSPLTPTEPLKATVIRLPLRSDAFSELSPRAVEPDEIRTLLNEFIREEMDTVMLFLRHLSTIIVKEVDEQGKVCILATAKLRRTAHSSSHDAQTHQVVVDVVVPGEDTRSATWLVVSRTQDLAPYAAQLSARIGRDVGTLLSREKLVPDVALAVPIAGGQHVERQLGRLYTFLPLPVTTGFPCLVNASFSLTADRQSLRNAVEHAAASSSHHVLVEWNKILFSSVLPVAWAALLSVGVDCDMDVFSLWPSTHSAEAHGQAVYWNQVSVILAREVYSRALPVWPRLVTGSSAKATTALSADVLVVNVREEGPYLDSLVRMGVQLCRVPPHIQRTLVAATCPVTPLSPSSAHAALLRPHVASFDSISSGLENPAIRRVILNYLLSARSLLNIINLPLIVTSDGYIALGRSLGIKCFVLDDMQEKLFGDVVPIYSRTRDLPPVLLDLLGDGRSWNVGRPAVSDVAALVAKVLAQDSQDMMLWSNSFWNWLASLPKPSRLEHYAAISSFPILPTSTSKFQAPSTGIYPLTSGVEGSETLRSLLEDCGLMFLHQSIPDKTLKAFDCLRSLRDTSSLLGHLSQRPNVLSAAPAGAIDELRAMLGDILATSRLSAATGNLLRSLPIFPVLAPGCAATRSSRRAIDVGAKIHITEDDIPLPHVSGLCFLQNTLPHQLVHSLGSDIAVIGLTQVLQIALDHFGSQTPDMQAAFVQRICSDSSLPRSMTARLSSLKFVSVAGGGAYSQPSKVVDPHSPISGLLDTNSDRIASMRTEAEQNIINGLSQLDLLIKTLTPTIASECIARISTSADTELAGRLFPLVNDGAFDAASSMFNPHARWIPCEDGQLRAPTECRDDSGKKKHQRALFDRVLAITAAPIVSAPLRSRLDWNSDIPLSVLKQQFIACVSEDPTPTAALQTLVHALASRKLESNDFMDLQAAATNRRWVPVENDECTLAAFAVLHLEGSLSPFQKVQDRTKSVRTFLTRMGCSERASSAAILQTLQTMHQSNDHIDPSHVRALLEAIDVASLDSQTLSQLPVPTDVGGLHVCSQTYYNDLGSRAYLVQLPDGARRAHDGISLGLARKLIMRDLSSLAIEEEGEEEEEDMDEDLPTRISNVLRQYNQDQMPTEYLANAVDAKASSVSFLVDEVDFSNARERLLVPSLVQLQAAGAIVIHNDTVFAEHDWKGIRRVGLGSKRHQPGYIGRFGLGALAAYHFSEVTMVISGSYFLLLDPSRRFLGKRASRRIKLHDMHVFFPDQLSPFVGLYGFEAQTDHYEGTIFRLPLRSHAHAQTSELSNNVMDLRTAQEFFALQETRVKLAVLFNPRLSNLAAAVRSSQRSDSLEFAPIWHLKVSRDDIKPNDPTLPHAKHAEIVVTSLLKGTSEVWRTGLHAFSKALVPPVFHGLFEKYLLPEKLSIGVALPRRVQGSLPTCSLFSHLPLPIATTLPFHVHASFILAEDRRSIRLDDASLANSESAYNRLLLAKLVPNLYLSVLHHWPVTGQPEDLLASGRFWPTQGADKVSQLIVNPLYERVSTERRLVCENVMGARIAPSAAMFTGSSLPSSVVQILELLRLSTLVTKPAAIEPTTSAQLVDANAIRKIFSHFPNRLAELYEEKIMSIFQLLDLIRFVLDNDDGSGIRLDGLRLLPLADGSLATFRRDVLPSDRDTTIFMLPNSSTVALDQVFPPSRFVHPGASGPLLDALPCSALQVKPFTDDALVYFVRTRLWPSHEAILSEDDAIWVRNLWLSFPSLHSSDELDRELHDRPMIPVLGQQGRHVSVTSCRRGSTMLRLPSASPAVVGVLTAMGASFIEVSQLPTSLRIRAPINSMRPSFSSVLQFLSLDQDLRRLRDLSAVQLAVLRVWLRAEIGLCYNLPPHDLRVARTLPLFCVRNSQSFAAADDVWMLPDSPIRIEDVLPLTTSTDMITPYEDSLARVLRVTPMTFSILGQMLTRARGPAQVINDAQAAAFRNLLQAILSRRDAIQEMQDSLQVPNTHGVYVRPDSLYSRRVPVFASVFNVQGRRRDVFLHASLDELDPNLQAFGMCVEVNVQSFEQCARVVQEATDRAKLESARAVYDCYREQLPFIRQRVPWQRFDNIQFIPRAAVRRKDAPTLDEYARVLPDIVSPSQILRSSFASVAWTQRAQPEVDPPARLVAEHTTLGEPTAEEVVAHIRVLSTIPSDHESRSIVARDVKASYKFLQDRLDTVSETVKESLKHGNLFLNVNDHLTDWTWCSAADLILGASDDGSTYKIVRGSLIKYSKLLQALKVHELVAVAEPEIKVTGVEGELHRLRGSFEAKRRAEIAIDIVFIDADDIAGRHPAHKIFLSACTSFFDDHFYSAGMRESVAMSLEPVETMNIDASGEALRRCLDYMYTGTFAAIKHEDLQILFDMLYLADFWRIEDLKSTVQRDLVTHITPDVYREIRGYADRYNASILLGSCVEWEKQNRDVLRRGVDAANLD